MIIIDIYSDSLHSYANRLYRKWALTVTTSDKIALFSAIGGWLSAAATVGAVWISLHIANRRPKVSVSCNVFEVKTMPLPQELGGKKLHMVVAKVTNQSNFIIRIYGVSLQIKNKVSFLTYQRKPFNIEFPQNLSYGEEFNISFTDNVDDWVTGMRNALKSSNLNPEKIRCVVHLSTGDTLYFPLDVKLLDKIKYN